MPTGRRPRFARGGRGGRTSAETAATPWESEDLRLNAPPNVIAKRALFAREKLLHG